MIATRQVFNQALIVLIAASTHFIANGSLAAEVTNQKQGDFKKSIQPMLASFCYDCHGRKKVEGEINLTKFTSWADLENNP